MTRSLAIILALVTASAVSNCGDPGTGPGTSDTGVETDSDLHHCEPWKEDGVTCDPIADAGVDAGSPITDGGTDAADSSTTDTEASDDATVTTDEGTPEECPPAAIPDGTSCPRGHCRLYWQLAPYCGATCEGSFGETGDNPLTPAEVVAGCGL